MDPISIHGSIGQYAQSIAKGGLSSLVNNNSNVGDARKNLAEVLGVDPSTIKFGDKLQKVDGKSQLSELFNNFVGYVDGKQKVAQEETFNVLSGQSSNLHQSVLASQEAGLAFTMLLEMRNKLVDGFKELMRMTI